MKYEVRKEVKDSDIVDIAERYLENMKDKKLRVKDIVKSKKYIAVFENVVAMLIDNQEGLIDNQGEEWSEEVDIVFDLFYKATTDLICSFDRIMSYPDSIFIRYNGMFIELQEFHGQGCYCSMSIFTGDAELMSGIVDFAQVVDLIETGIKPVRTQVLEVIYTSLRALSVVSESLELGIDIETAVDYIEENLN